MKIEKYTKYDTTYYRFRFKHKGKIYKRSGFNTKQAALTEYLEILEAKEEEIKGNILFTELFESWKKIYITKVKESTYHKTLREYELHILPKFKDKYIQDITIKECQEFANGLTHLVKGKHIVSQLRILLDYAMKLQYIKTNPVNNIITPSYKKSQKKLDFLEAEEVTKLLEYFKDHLYWLCCFRLLIYTGIRRGECLALEWEDIDFQNNKISITKTLTIGEDYKVIVSSAKTENSIREIYVDRETMLLLKKLKLQSTSKILFPNKKGTYTRLSNVQDMLNRATRLQRLKKIRVHDLRHTHASLSFASGSTVKTLQKRLGHSDIKTTMNIYVHTTKDDEIELVDNLVQYMERKG